MRWTVATSPTALRPSVPRRATPCRATDERGTFGLRHGTDFVTGGPSVSPSQFVMSHLPPRSLLVILLILAMSALCSASVTCTCHCTGCTAIGCQDIMVREKASTCEGSACADSCAAAFDTCTVNVNVTECEAPSSNSQSRNTSSPVPDRHRRGEQNERTRRR